MSVAPHIQAVLQRIDDVMRRDRGAARRAFVLAAAARYAADPAARTRTLRRLRIGDDDHVLIIGLVRERLALDRLLRRARPYDPPAPVVRWTLFAVWIGERRLREQTRAIARRFAPLQLAMAAE